MTTNPAYVHRQPALDSLNYYIFAYDRVSVPSAPVRYPSNRRANCALRLFPSLRLLPMHLQRRVFHQLRHLLIKYALFTIELIKTEQSLQRKRDIYNRQHAHTHMHRTHYLAVSSYSNAVVQLADIVMASH